MVQRPRAGWTVLVTGASSGLGRAMALELANRGYRLILAARNPERLATVVAEARQRGIEACGWTADLATPAGIQELIDGIRTVGWAVDALVNNAGASRAGRWADGSDVEDQGLQSLLIGAPLALTRHWLPLWRARGRGAVLNVASTGAFQAGPQTAVYYAAKAFLMSWSMALAQEERDWLVVTTVCPGAMHTGFAASAGKVDVPGAPEPGKIARIAIDRWERNRALVIPGWGNRVLVLVSRIAPVSVTARVVDAIQRSVKKR